MLGDTLETGVAKQALQRSASERNEGQVVRHRLNKISNEAVIMGVELHK